MKARIIVTLMIALSMCTVCTADLEEDKKHWYEEGYLNGEDNGHYDGYQGNAHSYSGMNYPSHCPVMKRLQYRTGYEEGYDDGYQDGADQAEEEANENPVDDPEEPDNTTQPPNDTEPPVDQIPVISKPADKEDPENCMSSPSLGLGFKYPNGTVTQRGDHVPTLYTWAEVDDKYEHHTTLTFLAEGTYTGCVIITLPQIAGEPLVPSGFWDTAKGQRILQWKANAG